MMLIYVAIALFIVIILWLALQPKQGTKAANAPDPDDTSHQLPKPKQLETPPKTRDTQKLPKITYELPKPTEASSNIQGTTQARLSLLMQQGRKIEAIKLVRSETDWGLKQAKNYVELFPNCPPLPSQPVSENARPVESAGSIPQDVEEQVQSLMQQHRKIEAIKLIRTETGWGLRESKYYVEQVENSDTDLASTTGTPTIETFDIDRHDINDRVRILMQQHRKIEAIKVVRTVTNWGLRECKEYLDRYPDVTPLTITETGPVSPKIRQLLSDQNYMEAIHLVECRTGMMASEAKEYIEHQFNYKFPF